MLSWVFFFNCVSVSVHPRINTASKCCIQLQFTTHNFQPSTSKHQKNAPLAKNSYLGIYALDQINKFWGEKYITHVLKPCFLTEHMEVYMFPHTVVKWLIDLQASCSFWMHLMLHCLCNSETITSDSFFWAGSSISLCAAGVGLSLCNLLPACFTLLWSIWRAKPPQRNHLNQLKTTPCSIRILTFDFMQT